MLVTVDTGDSAMNPADKSPVLGSANSLSGRHNLNSLSGMMITLARGASLYQTDEVVNIIIPIK